MGQKEYISIGYIISTHGVKGEVKVLPLTDDAKRYSLLKDVYIENGLLIQKHVVEGIKYFKKFVIVKFKDINDMGSAQKIKGSYLMVDRKNAVKLPEGAHFICDLIGCEVFDDQGNKLGIVDDVFNTGSNDVYVIIPDKNQNVEDMLCQRSEEEKSEKSKKPKEILIPVLKDVVESISIDKKKIIVHIPEGLLD